MVTRTITLLERISRILPALNWEVHVLQAGIHKYVLRRPWSGVPIGAVSLAGIWTLYWFAVPVILALQAVAWVLRPLEVRLRRSA